MESTSIIRKPLITEKGTLLRDTKGQYIFEVDRSANKYQIKMAIQKQFNVKVDLVRTSIVRGKVKRVGRSTGKRPNWKKAVVTLKEGDKIDFFEGV